MHPLCDNLSALKDSELENKIQELTRKYFMTSNYEVQHQVTMLLDLYKQELSQRQAKMWQNQFEKRNKDLDKLINVQ